MRAPVFSFFLVLAIACGLPFFVAFHPSVIAIQRLVLNHDEIIIGGATIYSERDWRLSSSRESAGQHVMLFGLIPSELVGHKRHYWPGRYFHFVDAEGSYISFVEFDDTNCETERVLASLETRPDARFEAVNVSGHSALAYSPNKGMTIITVPSLHLQITVSQNTAIEGLRIVEKPMGVARNEPANCGTAYPMIVPSK